MNKTNKLITCLILFFSIVAHADEGMWIPKNLSPQSLAKMQELGFTMNFEDLYNENNPSLKDAIVQLNIGCTGVSVSSNGLIFTNHHCGYNAIQSLSSVEHDYLTDGFVSHSFTEELPVPGMTIRYFIKVEDVSKQVLAKVTPDMGEEERMKLAYETLKELQTNMNLELKNDNMEVEIIPYYANNVYYANFYRKFTDIRLVFAPPSSVGKFGGDTDNWMWPRHTGDFSVFRVYAGKDNLPADYSPENKPYSPAYVAPVSLDGYAENSFSMIMGYPGSTNRYLSSWGVEQRMKSANEPRIEVRGIKQEIWMDAMLKDDATRIKYASKYMGSSNFWKNSIGMNRGIEQMQVIQRKQTLESQFKTWLGKNPEMKAKYGDALDLLREGYTSTNEVKKEITYLQEAISGAEILGFAYYLPIPFDKIKKGETQKETVYEEDFVAFYKDYEASLDQKTLAAMLHIIKKHIPANKLPEAFKEIDKKYKGNYEKYAADLFKKSAVPYPEKMKSLLADKDALKKIVKDPAFLLANSLMETLNSLREDAKKANYDIQKGERLFMAGLIDMMPEKDFPSDANFTLRLTYGSVGGYRPFDGAWYNYFTTPKGIFEKYRKDDPEFNVQPEILNLLAKGDFGRYGDMDTLPVNFLSNNDITGGNSGSPIFDGRGRVIGLAFDGNWEAMSGDIAFETEIQRTINVDIRYVLYIIEKWGKAHHLIDELIIE